MAKEIEVSLDYTATNNQTSCDQEKTRECTYDNTDAS